MPRKSKARQAIPKRKGPGRPSDWRDEHIETVTKLAYKGWTKVEIAAFLEVTYRTFARWCVAHPELEKACHIPEQAANDRVVLSLYHQAMGYERDEEKIEVIEGEIVRVKIKRFYPPNASAAIFWLKAKAGLHDNPALAAPKPPEEGTETKTIEGQDEPIRHLVRRLNLVVTKRAS